MCSTSIEQARSFSSNVCVVLPRRPFTMIYSLEVRDFLEVFLRQPDLTGAKGIGDWLESMHYKSVDDTHFVEPEFFGEVMVYCEKYCAEPIST